MRDALKASTGLTVYLLSLPPDAYPAAVTKELQLDVKWGLDGVSASHSLLEKTAIAVLMDTITTLTAFDIQCTQRPPNLLQVPLWVPLFALQAILAHPAVSRVFVTTEGLWMGYAML